MIRIGKVTCYLQGTHGVPCFRLVVENGRAVLGCWHYSHTEGFLSTRTVFKRIS